MYYPEYYNSIKFVLNEDGTIGGNFSENYGDYTKNWKWIKNENNSIKITWEYYESVEWEKRESILNIFNVSNGKVLAGDFGVIFFSSIDIINSFTYLREGDYTNDVTISSTMIDGYKFGMWTDSDGTVPYFTDGDYVINGRGYIYHMNGQNKFEEFEYKGN